MEKDGNRPLTVAVALVLTLGTTGLTAAAGHDPATPFEPSTTTADADGFREGLVEALLTGHHAHDEAIHGALDAAEAAFHHHLDSEHRVTSPAQKQSLQAQLANIGHAGHALDLMHADDVDAFEQSIRLAQLGTLWQAHNLDLDTSVLHDVPQHEAPSQALETLLERHEATLDADQKEEALGLDQSPASHELARLLDAFIGLEIATSELAQALPEPSTPVQEQAQLFEILDRIEDGEITTHHELMDAVELPERTERASAPDELGTVLAHRSIVLDAALDLRNALEASTETHPETFDEPGVIRIDLTGEDALYEEDYRYVVEAGGANTYHNNAGGTNVGGGSCYAPVEEPTTAALIDLGTQDKTFGHAEDPYFCGSNGAGFAGFDHGAVGVGMLVTAGGDNTYTGENLASNGGGHGQAAGVGVGLLVDGDGENVFDGGALGGNGAGSNGFFEEPGGVGVGLLVSGGGSDVLDAFTIGANGGAVEWGAGNAHGGVMLVDGDDEVVSSSAFGVTGGVYVRTASVAHAFLVNGGGSNTYAGNVGAMGSVHSGDDTVATALLVDADGGSTYSGYSSVNGAAIGGPGVALLVSGEGDDTYDTWRNPVNGATWRGDGARAMLVDAGGDDAYLAGDEKATNGGAYEGHGYGALVDLGGDDTYVSPSFDGVNGGVGVSGCLATVVFFCAPSTVGLLLDAGGEDYYEDGHVGACWDCSLVPKGTFGAQIDAPPSP